jgi:transposase
MGQVLHGSARTTEAVRRAIQLRQESVRALAKRFGVSPTTIQKWRKRSTTADAPMGPKQPRSTVLTPEEEALVVAFRRHTLLPLDDCLYGLQPTIPHLTRSSLHRCLERHGISRLPEMEGEKPKTKRFAHYAIGYFHIDMFDRVCGENDIEHRLTKPNHPWTNGQVERMNRTLKEATVKRYHYESHDQLRAHLQLFLDAYNHARRLKTLRGLTPYEHVLHAWTKEPKRFRLDPSHHIPGPYI